MCTFLVTFSGGGGGVGEGQGVWFSHVMAYMDVPPKWVTFSPKVLRYGSHFGQKKPSKEGPISQKLEKKKKPCKISCF